MKKTNGDTGLGSRRRMVSRLRLRSADKKMSYDLRCLGGTIRSRLLGHGSPSFIPEPTHDEVFWIDLILL